MKACVCFFGLTRSLKYTIDSINENLFKILKLNNIQYDIYLHTYDLKILTNKRSQELNCELDTDEYKLLNPKKYIIDNQDEFDKKFDYKSVEKFGDSWKDNFSSLRNLIRQLNSLKKVFSLIENKKNYDSYIFCRPDLRFLNEIDIKYILSSKNENVIITPYWQKCGGCNDRFAIGSLNSIKYYANRIDYIYEYMNDKGKLHSESLVKFVIDKFNIKNIDCDIFLCRVRANNKIKSKDMNFYKSYKNKNKKKKKNK
tara:strand:+ start:847 stop:1614 length:768 start_codon:yes stop_codon:yes gene_type:complete